MGLSTAEKNRRKRERKKREKEERRKQEEEASKAKAEHTPEGDADVEIEYVVDTSLDFASLKANGTATPQESAESVPAGLPPEQSTAETRSEDQDIMAVLEKFHQRAAFSAVVSDDDAKKQESDVKTENDSDKEDEQDDAQPMSKRKLRESLRPTVAELKRRVKHPHLVEAHDITAADPEFLIHLKGIKGTVQVPRHWGRKRKYLQGKRGFEKPPFKVSHYQALTSTLGRTSLICLTVSFSVACIYCTNRYHRNPRHAQRNGSRSIREAKESKPS